MKNKAILLGVIAVTLLTTVGTAFAAPNWDITGTWALTFNIGDNYYHTMFVNVFNQGDGTFSGTGYWNGDQANYPWTVAGTVIGDGITFHILYGGTGNPGYTVDASGTIASNGLSMSGTWNGENTWTGTGKACDLRVDSDCDGVPNTQDFCPETVADTSYKTLGEGMNRWIWDGKTWVTVLPTKGKGPTSLFADKKISDYTYGCSCEQILTYLHANYPETYGNMVGHWKYGCSRSLLEDWHNGLYYIETVTVPANKDTETLSSIALQGDKNYVLKAYGTATACWETGCQITFDAEYSTSDGGLTWVDGVAPPYDGYGKNLLDLMVNGGYVDWGTYNSAHTYWLPVVGAGTLLPFSLQVNDIYYPNNAGNLNVDIYAKL